MSIAKEHRWLLLAVCAAQFFMPFMVAGVNAVLPPLGESLGASARELSLLGAVYTLGLVVFQLAGGTLGDIYGRRRVFLFGLSLFSVLALVLGFIPHIDVFIGLRLFQGMGAAMLSSSSLALLASAAPKEMRASYLGLSGVAVYAGIACGPPVGGLVAGWLGWRWLFWGTGLAALAAMCIMIFRVPLEWRTADKEPFDVPGCLLYGGPDLWRVLYRGRSSAGRRALFALSRAAGLFRLAGAAQSLPHGGRAPAAQEQGPQPVAGGGLRQLLLLFRHGLFLQPLPAGGAGLQRRPV